MKLKTKADAGLGPLRFIPLENIVDSPDLPAGKIDKEWAKDLQGQIKAKGLDTPLNVWDGGSKDTTMTVGGRKGIPASFLVAGAHRRFALKALKREEPEVFAKLFPNGIPCTIRSGSTADAYAARVRENVQRRDPDATELLDQVTHLRDTFKLKNKDIAKAVGKSDAWVSKIFSIGEELGEETVQKVKDKKIGLREATDAAASVRKGKDKVEAVKTAEAKTAARGDRQRTEKRLTAKSMHQIYLALPRMAIGAKIILLEKGLSYLAGDTDQLPTEYKHALKEQAEAKKLKIKKVTKVGGKKLIKKKA
jgi:ParB-like chromosome segregation protein Spo0J